MVERSETVSDLMAALSKFQGQIRSVPKTSTNPFFHSKYASLDAIWEMCRKPLFDNGLALVQTTAVTEGILILETTLAHTSGQWVSGRYPLTPMRQVKDAGWQPSDDPQSMGSVLTYARRYAMSAILGISADEDDDAERVMARDKVSDTSHTQPDNRYYCAEHKDTWTKRTTKDGSWYSHQISGTGKWCNMKDAPISTAADRSDDAILSEAPKSATDFAELVANLPKVTNATELAGAAKQLGYRTAAEARAVVGPASEITDWPAAAYKLIQSSPLALKVIP